MDAEYGVGSKNAEEIQKAPRKYGQGSERCRVRPNYGTAPQRRILVQRPIFWYAGPLQKGVKKQRYAVSF